jgi:hypothetical protein
MQDGTPRLLGENTKCIGLSNYTARLSFTLLFAIRQKKNFICEVPSAGIHGSVIR